MQRGLVHTLAWTLATGAAVTLSWWGVHTVMSGTVYDPPRAVPIAGAASDGSGAASPQVSSTRRPSASPEGGEPSKSPGGGKSGAGGGGKGDSAGRSPSKSPSASPSGGGSGPASSGRVKGYSVDGGRVVFDMRAASAELVSATPNAGWEMQVWKQESWIRVTFTREGREISVFCTWHAHAPLVEIDER
ncbi:hypothetical protein DY218_10900 [Streptomyces triticagri]|uniref:Secreted protein n=1 Tax=Streptomyces triticagri TaxID=2293568 RepID=A0A372M6S7_9ACTN|nr:hypothetical protein [Streptomyces triticagri]RFU86644.1 hypothetical protein DY218_10900 [Streptomyces triticagri]